MSRYLHLKADCDPSGNPQRLFVAWRGESTMPVIIDEGYGGAAPVSDCEYLGCIYISKSEYHYILKHGLR
jgi:hypothetical protein